MKPRTAKIILIIILSLIYIALFWVLPITSISGLKNGITVVLQIHLLAGASIGIVWSIVYLIEVIARG